MVYGKSSNEGCTPKSPAKQHTETSNAKKHAEEISTEQAFVKVVTKTVSALHNILRLRAGSKASRMTLLGVVWSRKTQGWRLVPSSSNTGVEL